MFHENYSAWLWYLLASHSQIRDTVMSHPAWSYFKLQDVVFIESFTLSYQLLSLVNSKN